MNNIKIASFNINSLRLRLPLLKDFVELANPDIVCLQEIKVQDTDFPLLEVKNLGFDFVEFSGEKSYNGVAILSKFPLKNIQKIDVLGYGHKRHISAEIKVLGKKITIHNFYIPAGGDEADVTINPKFDHKLKFLDWMADYFSKRNLEDRYCIKSGVINEKTTSEVAFIIVGDFNIAPLEHDVWSHRQLLEVVSHTPIEVEKLRKIQKSLNFIDTHRHFVDEKEKLYSWWSYRAIDPMKSNRGRRLDHIWCSKNLEKNIKAMKFFSDFRSKKSPSDHIPILTEFSF
jgi:exodeoxyribonuclease-3